VSVCRGFVIKANDVAVEDADVVRQQQEEEFQRRLKGEYEASQVRVGSVVSLPGRSRQNRG